MVESRPEIAPAARIYRRNGLERFFDAGIALAQRRENLRLRSGTQSERENDSASTHGVRAPLGAFARPLLVTVIPPSSYPKPNSSGRYPGEGLPLYGAVYAISRFFRETA